MKLALIGVDYKTAGIELREAISLTESRIKLILERLKATTQLDGAAIISTCNRTELYLSYQQFKSKDDLIDIFSQAVGFYEEDMKQHIYIKKGEEVITYLFELTVGMHSMIFGDDQITAQVGNAIELANGVNASDSILNTLFRHAITCAKKIKTSVTLKSVSPSVATEAVQILREYIRNKKNCKVLVIGNGEIGRSVSKVLLKEGCEVYMTLRTYKYKQDVVPVGCKTIDYESRGELFPKVDILISATKSPHHTVSYEAMAICKKRPIYLMDLALPRDIDPKIKELEDIIYYDIDTIGSNARYDNSQEISTIQEIISEQYQKFKEWLLYRNKKHRPLMEEYKR